jgi:hypothetical protein
LCVASAFFCYGALNLGIGRLGRPGPGFFPMLTGTIVGLFSLIMIVRSIRASTRLTTSPGRLITLRTALALMCLSLFGLLIDRLGFFVCTFFFIMITLSANGVRKWPFLVMFAFLVCVAIFVCFNLLLEARLPLGILRLVRP